MAIKEYKEDVGITGNIFPESPGKHVGTEDKPFHDINIDGDIKAQNDLNIEVDGDIDLKPTGNLRVNGEDISNDAHRHSYIEEINISISGSIGTGEVPVVPFYEDCNLLSIMSAAGAGSGEVGVSKYNIDASETVLGSSIDVGAGEVKPLGINLDASDTGYGIDSRKNAIVFKGKLYVGLNSGGGGSIRVYDGTSWSTAYNPGEYCSKFIIYNNRLFAMGETNVYVTEDGATWTVSKDLSVNEEAFIYNVPVEYEGYFYIWDGENGDMWRYSDTGQWENLGDVISVSQITDGLVHDGILYMSDNAGNMITFDGTTWSTDALGYGVVHSMIEFQDDLLIGCQTSANTIMKKTASGWEVYKVFQNNGQGYGLNVSDDGNKLWAAIRTSDSMIFEYDYAQDKWRILTYLDTGVTAVYVYDIIEYLGRIFFTCYDSNFYEIVKIAMCPLETINITVTASTSLADMCLTLIVEKFTDKE